MKAVKIVVVVLLVGAAGFVLVRNLGGVVSDDQPQRIGMERWVACANCGWHAYVHMSDRPAECPRCEQIAVWPASRCSNGHVVSMDQFNMGRSEPSCPVCGDGDLQRIPEDADMPPIPEWDGGPGS
jgi:hypothetical protein